MLSDTEGKDDDRASNIAGSSTLLLALALGVEGLLEAEEGESGATRQSAPGGES